MTVKQAIVICRPMSFCRQYGLVSTTDLHTVRSAILEIGLARLLFCIALSSPSYAVSACLSIVGYTETFIFVDLCTGWTEINRTVNFADFSASCCQSTPAVWPPSSAFCWPFSTLDSTHFQIMMQW